MICLSRASARHTPVRSYWLVLTCIALLSASLWGASNDDAKTPSTQVDVQAHQSVAGGNEIRLLIAKYAESVDAADTALASRIWSHSPEVSFIHPLGEEHGFEQIAQDVYTHLMGDTFSERDLQIHDISVHVYGKAAWAEFYWDFRAKFRKDGSPLTTHGRETQVYHKEKDGWRLVHVHYSGTPVTEGKKGF